MRKRLVWLCCIAAATALVNAGLSSLRPIALSSLIEVAAWEELQSMLGFEAWGIAASPVAVLLTLELADSSVLLAQGFVLSVIASTVGRMWRIALARSVMRSMAAPSGDEAPKFVVLTKSYVEVLEVYFRLYLLQSAAAAVQLLISLGLAFAMNRGMALLLVAEMAVFLAITAVYAPIQASLVRARLSADEKLLVGADLAPRKGTAIWFGGLGNYWLGARFREVRAVAAARFRTSLAEATYLQCLTTIGALFVPAGYLVLVVWGGSQEQFVPYIFYAGLLIAPVLRLSSFVPETREFLIAKAGLKATIARVGQPTRPMPLVEPLTFAADLLDPQSAHNPDIDLKPGDRVAIVGPSGAGKTMSVLSLLGAQQGFLNARVSGVPAKHAALGLPQLGVRYLADTPVFESGSVIHNARTDQHTFLQISHELGLFPNLTASEIAGFLGRHMGPNGEPLSLGERQRIQLVRAAASKPAVLILDEALSGLEESLECAVVKKLIADRTISILVHIGHRQVVQSLFERKIILDPARLPVGLQLGSQRKTSL